MGSGVIRMSMTAFNQALALAIHHHQAGRLAEAKDIYRRLIVDHPEMGTPLYLLAQAERHSGDRRQAALLLCRVLERNPLQEDAWMMLADTLFETGNETGGLKVLKRALAVAPEAGTILHSLGARLCSHGGEKGLEEAIRLLRRVVALAPDKATALHDLAVALNRTGRLDAALAAEEQAVALRPDFGVGRMTLGNLLNEAGDRDRAKASQQFAIALAPVIAAPYFNLGNTLHSRGELDAALASYRRAVLLGLPQARLRMAIVLIQMGRFDEAEAELVQAPRIAGADISASIDLLADLLGDRGRLVEGRAVLESLPVSPAADGVNYRGECVIGVANLLLREGRAQEAAQMLNRVSGDSSRLFTLRSLAVFKVTLDAMGAQVRRPPPLSTGLPRVTSSSLATHGRFAHNVLEYVLIRLYAEKYGYVLETPEWVGGYYFNINHPLSSRPLSPLYFPRHIINGLVAGSSTLAPIPDCDILSPLFLLEHREEYRERVQSWLQPRPVWTPFIAPGLERLRSLGDTVVAIHIRRGDFVSCQYPLTETAWYAAWLRSIWGGLKNPVLYLASDDIDGVRADFAEFRPVVRADVTDRWPGLEYLQDFHILCNADIVGVSAASGFSLLAARLNTTARLFVEPDLKTGRIRSFAPWTTPAAP